MILPPCSITEIFFFLDSSHKIYKNLKDGVIKIDSTTWGSLVYRKNATDGEML